MLQVEPWDVSRSRKECLMVDVMNTHIHTAYLLRRPGKRKACIRSVTSPITQKKPNTGVVERSTSAGQANFPAHPPSHQPINRCTYQPQHHPEDQKPNWKEHEVALLAKGTHGTDQGSRAPEQAKKEEVKETRQSSKVILALGLPGGAIRITIAAPTGNGFIFI